MAVFAAGALAADAFNDVGPDYPASAEITAAHQIGVFQGYDDGTFRPDSELTRVQADRVIRRMLDWQGTDDDGNFKITRADMAVLAMSGLCGLDYDRIPGCVEIAATETPAPAPEEGLGSATVDGFTVTVERLVPLPNDGVRIDYTAANTNRTDYRRASFDWAWVAPDGWQVTGRNFGCPGEQANGVEIQPSSKAAFTACLSPLAADSRFNADLAAVDWTAPGGALVVAASSYVYVHEHLEWQASPESVIPLAGPPGYNPLPPKWWRTGYCPPPPGKSWSGDVKPTPPGGWEWEWGTPPAGWPDRDGLCIFTYDDGSDFGDGPPQSEVIERCEATHGGYSGRVTNPAYNFGHDGGRLECDWPYGPPHPWPAESPATGGTPATRRGGSG